MSGSETTEEGMHALVDGFTPGQQAAIATAAATVTGALLAAIGLALDLSRNEVIVGVSGLVVFVLVGVVYAFFRAMMLSADETEGDPTGALTYPLFPVLYAFLAVAVGLFVGVAVRYL